MEKIVKMDCLCCPFCSSKNEFNALEKCYYFLQPIDEIDIVGWLYRTL
jgi:hypothetical protein